MSSTNSSSVELLTSLLRDTLRVLINDNRIFIGTFVGTDKAMNILLVNTDEFRLGPDENPNGRFVGQVLIPWEFVQKVEVQAVRDSGEQLGAETGAESPYM
ncbi:hypothetical protein K488DRAFT_51205 [Vararia minispora EC-137]|uniref:Uncharacterized protein n=1 Tax=Vararia minispora EC-137 TaxID=1314806 RepID=A0ACB8QJL1_9AGAM|nr:hypothetical protein K488DRAFT_51205 [Vararia minispora EC-137]